MGDTERFCGFVDVVLPSDSNKAEWSLSKALNLGTCFLMSKASAFY
jgi:hypothetical protein